MMIRKKNHPLAVSLLLVWTALLLGPGLAAASDPNGGWDPLHSPDGKKVAFLSSSMHMPGALWVMGPDGKNRKKLTEFGVENLSWSKDGETLFFSRWGEKTANLWELKLNGFGVPQKVAAVPETSLNFAFSPDRSRIAYILASDTHRDLWVQKADGSEKTGLTDKLYVRFLTWAPDGEKILFVEGRGYGNGIWSADMKNGSIQNLVRGFCGDPVFSVQGDHLAYAFPLREKDQQGRFGIRVMNPDGSGSRELKAPHLADPEIAWNADGSALCYLGPAKIKEEDPSHKMTHGKTGSQEPEEESALWVLSLKNGEEKRLTPQGFSVDSFSWSPDGKEIILGGAGRNGFGSELWRMETATAKLSPLVEGRYTEWASTPSADATQIAFLSNRNRKGMLVIADDSGREIRKFDPFPISGDDRIAHLYDGSLLFLYNAQGFRVVDLGEKTRLHLQINPKFSILEIQPSIREQKVLINALQNYDGFPQVSLLAGKGETMQEIGLGGKGLELQPRWSFDGKKIALTDGTDLWIMDPDGRNRRPLTHFRAENKNPGLVKTWMDRFRGGASQSHVSDPFWAPDGKRIGFILTVYDQEESPERRIRWITPDGTSSGQIYSERVAIRNQALVSDRTNPPFFDIDGQRVIFTSMVKGLPNLLSLTLEGKTVQVLTDTGAIFPALLPEKDKIVYTSLEGENERLMIMNLDGSGKRPFLAEQPEGKEAVKQ